MGLLSSFFQFARPRPRPLASISAGPTMPLPPGHSNAPVVRLDPETLRTQMLGKIPWERPEDAAEYALLDTFPDNTRKVVNNFVDTVATGTGSFSHAFEPPESEVWRITDGTFNPQAPGIATPLGSLELRWELYDGEIASSALRWTVRIPLTETGAWIQHDLTRGIRSFTIRPTEILQARFDFIGWGVRVDMHSAFFIGKASMK